MSPPGWPEHSCLTVRVLCLDVAPAFTQLPVDTTVTDGMTAVLRCEVSGAPRPAIVWRRGRRLAPASGGELPLTCPFCDKEAPLTERPPGTRSWGVRQTRPLELRRAHCPKKEHISLPRAGRSFLLQALRWSLGPGGPLNLGARLQPLCDGGAHG